jgi:hypothetical protein
LKGNIFNEFQINDKCTVALNQVQAIKLAQEGKYPIIRIPATPIDYVTEYKFTRRKIIYGEKVITTAIGRFSLNDATQADLLSKDTYKKYARVMIANRAFSLGAREIADDILMGMMETSELKLVTDTPLTSDDFIDVEEVN